MASVKRSLGICSSDIELELKEIELRKNKAIAKSKFTRYRLDVLFFLVMGAKTWFTGLKQQ